MANLVKQQIMWARVSYTPVAAQAALAALALSPEAHGPGLSAGDAVQVAAYLATLRDVVATFNPMTGGPGAQILEYDKSNKQVCIYNVNAQQAVDVEDHITSKGNRGVLLVGDAEFYGWSTQPATRADGIQVGPVDAWGKKLALALDQVLEKIGSAEQGPNIPVGMAQAVNAAIPLAALAVVVTGAALAIIGAVAAWRYLDPDFRRDALAIKTAAENYAQRLNIMTTTGQMPPPSENEKSAAQAVESYAKERSTTDWLWGAGIFVGLIGGTLISVKIAGSKA